MIRRATAEEIQNWDALVKSNPDGGNMLQCRAFAETKAEFGWKPFYSLYELPNAKLAVLYLLRPVRGLGELWYVPKGPGVISADQLAEFILATEDKVQNSKLPPFAAKLEPELKNTEMNRQSLLDMGLLKVRDIQFNHATVVVDLRPSEDDIIGSFKQKTRYNIRLAERRGVMVEAVDATSTNIDQMYQLMQATQARAGFYLRSRDYFATFWAKHAQQNTGQLFLAKYQGQILAGAFVTYLGEKALYKDGGSSREHSDLQAPYLLQWEAMRWLKAKGVYEYDLHGTPPADQLENANHPLHSLVRFKTGFGADITEYVGTWDLPINQSKYALWQKLGERLATAYSYRIKKQLFY